MFIYILIIVFTLWVILSELKDLYCPDGGAHPLASYMADCRDGEGCHIKRSCPSDDDSPKNLREKIQYGIEINKHTVFWRRSYLSGLLISLLTGYMYVDGLPDEKNLLITLIIATMIIYFTYSYYNFHHGKHIQKNMTECVERLSKVNLYAR